MERTQETSTNRKESLVMSPCCLVCWVLSCQFADIPVSHRAPMNPSLHWHWNAPNSLIHVPPFWHGLLLLLAHSSMSENKTQAWTFFAWFVTFCIFKKLLVSFYNFKRTILPRYPKQVSLLWMVSQKTWAASNFGFKSDIQSHTADDMRGDRWTSQWTS